MMKIMGSKINCTRLAAALYSSCFFVLILNIFALNFKETTAYYTHHQYHEEDYSYSSQNHFITSFTTLPTINEPGRSLLETTENGTREVRDLGDTVRVDPLDNFNKYRGGFDIKNKHYWSSTVFTGIYGYAIAAVWFLLGLVYGGFLLATSLCCRHKEKSKLKKRKLHCSSRQCSLLPILLGTSLTILAIAASGVVLGGSSRFHSKAETVMNIIIETADGASDTIYNVTGAMRNIRDNLGTTEDGAEAIGFLNSTSQSLDTEAAEISRQAKKNRDLIEKGLKIVYITTTIVVALNLVALIALSVSGFLKLRRPIYMFIILCWLLAVLCWVYFGLYFSVEKFLGDTCTALEDFQQDPHNNSLSSIVPCDELRSAKSVLLDTRVGIYNLINEVNANISALQSPSSPILVRVCNPFTAPPDYNYQPECPANTIQVGDIPQVIQILTCSNGDGETCKKGEFISVSDFKRVEAYTSSIQNLLDAFPGMESLVDCQVVKDAFTEILSKHCKPVKKYAKMVWSSMVVFSSIMVVLVLTWTAIASHDTKHHFSDGSVKPHSEGTNVQELEIARAGINQSEQKLDP